MKMKISPLCILLIFSLMSIYQDAVWAQGYLCAVGGGSENYNNWSDIPYKWMVEKSGKGPVLVLHYSEGSSWLENYFKSFGATTAQSLVISNRAAANDSANYRTIVEAKLIFLRGGDQSRYYSLWKGTLVEQAIMKVFQNGGVIGGTSAGLAVLGGIDYTATTPSSAVSSTSLNNPFHRDITLADDFLPLLPEVIFDSHFTARGRIGRLMAFIAQWNVSHHADILGIGVDERTAVCIEPDGVAMVAGAGAAFFLHAGHDSYLTCEANKPLFFTEWSLHTLTQGFRYHIRTRQLSSIPEGAKSIQPTPLPLLNREATFLLHGGISPSLARSSLQELVSKAGDAPILIVGGAKGEDFFSYLKNSLQAQNIELLTLTAENIHSDVAANKIRNSLYLVIAGFATAERNALLLPLSPVQNALIEACHNPQVTAFLSGPAVSLLGSLFVKNPDSNANDLHEGKLIVANGWEVMTSTVGMHQGFYYDDYIENRVGGIFWLLFRQPHALAWHLDDACQIKIEQNKLTAYGDQPLILIDTQSVSIYDSSRYRSRSYNLPRQTAAFYGAKVHCIPRSENGYFDLQNRQWITTTPVRSVPPSATIPDAFNLQIYPNPSNGEIRMLHNGTNASQISEIKICTIQGRLVRYFKDPFASGSVLIWNGLDAKGQRVANGTYLLLYKNGQHYQAQNCVLVR